MAIINTGLLTAGLRSEFYNRLNAVPTYYGELSTRVVSTKDKESYKWLGSVPTVRERGAGRVAKGLRTESYDITNLDYEATLEVDRNEIADDQTGQIRLRVGELAQRAATHKDYLIGQLLANGASSGYLSYDGQIFFSAAHTSGDSGTQDNDLTYNATDHTSVTAAEFRASLALAVAAMAGFKDDQGQPINTDMTGMIAVVPTALFFAAQEAVGATLLSSTTNTMQGLVKVLPYPWLSSGVEWYLLKTSGVIRPFVFQDREPISFDALAEGSEEEFKRGKYLYGVSARYAMSYGYWQYAVKTTFN